MERCVANAEQNQKYCSKSRTAVENTWFEMGDPPKQGVSIKLNELKAKAKEGTTPKELYKTDPDTFVKHRKLLETHYELSKEIKDEEGFTALYKDKPLRPSQQNWLGLLESQNDRQVLWIYDNIGNNGKSWFSNWLVANRGAARMENASTKDLAYLFNGEPYVAIDYTRSVEGRVNYNIIESLKNGSMVSAKYHTKVKLFKPPKVICFSNFWPEQDKLSQDRWQIIDCSANSA